MALKKRTIRASPATTTTTPVTNAQLKALIDQGVADALVARDADRSMNGDDSHDSGTGVRRQAPLARECTYLDFMKCKPLYFKGTEGVFELTQWFERMEIVFHIRNCTVENQIKFATCTLLGSALTWWNVHVRTVGHDVAYEMTWTNLKEMMTDKYYPRGEIKKLEVEMWNLKVKGSDVVGYNQRFQELALMCARMFPEESDKIEKYVGGLPDMIHGSVMASKPKTMQDEIEFATELMDKKISIFAKRQAKNKRKLDNNNQAQQQPLKKQGVAIAYTDGSGERKEYAGTLPLCNKQKFHHNGQYTIKCGNFKRVGHLTQDCRSLAATNNQRNLTCYECGIKGTTRVIALCLVNPKLELS
ncbi:reverse transcriptase domain-containing protein [Tanacetum coccineum]